MNCNYLNTRGMLHIVLLSIIWSSYICFLWCTNNLLRLVSVIFQNANHWCRAVQSTECVIGPATNKKCFYSSLALLQSLVIQNAVYYDTRLIFQLLQTIRNLYPKFQSPGYYDTFFLSQQYHNENVTTAEDWDKTVTQKFLQAQCSLTIITMTLTLKLPEHLAQT